MFTGLIEELGEIKGVENGVNSIILDIKCKKILEDIKLGDSISVNGICLTVTSYDTYSFKVDVMPVTLKKSSLKGIKKGMIVNLERALTFNKRLGGHLVSGHIDCIGNIKKITKNDNAYIFRIEIPDDVSPCMIAQGSITIDGISLTLSNVFDREFEISIIPTTYKDTNLSYKKIGSFVNIEWDMIGKYVKKFINNEDVTKSKKDISIDFLRKNGF